MGIRMMNHMLWDDPREFLEKFGMTALHAILAWSIIAPFWVLIIFLFSLPVLREAFRRRTVVVAQTTPNPPPVHPVP
jgi:hypothetical protein